MTQRIRALARPGPLAALAATVLAVSTVSQIESRLIGTADGSRFLLVPFGSAPIIHWVSMTPAGELVDPPEFPGLSFAVARSTLSGTDTIGTSSWTEEQRVQRQLDAAMVEVVLGIGKGDIPPEIVRRVEQLKGRIDRLRDPTAWQRAMLAAPSLDFRIRELPDAVVVGVTTTRAGFATVARLLMDRRENAILRDLQAKYVEVTQERAARIATDEERVRSEIVDLAFFGAGTRLKAVNPIASEDVARDLYRKMFAPSVGYHVITGGFDLDEMQRFLQNQFNITSNPPWRFPERDIRRESSERMAVLSDGDRRGIAVGLQSATALGHDELLILAEWFAGGSRSFLAQRFEAAGMPGIECRATTPFPAGAKPGLVLVEAWTSADPRLATTGDLVAPLREALADAASRVRNADLAAARKRAVFARDLDRADPVRLAYWLAIECGVHGRPAGSALALAAPAIDEARYGTLAESLFDNGYRTIVVMEATP